MTEHPRRDGPLRLRDLLNPRTDRVLERWVEASLAAYSAQAGVAWTREQDPFANPVGHSLRTGTRALFAALLGDADDATLRGGLDGIVRIRAVQQLTPAQAVGFVFCLKDVVRAELGEALEERALRLELVELEARIDRAALAAFDLFMEYRAQVSELRINELKRNIPWAVKRTNRVELEQEPG